MPQDAKLLLLDGPTVSAALQPEQVIAAVREAFVLHSDRKGRVFPVIREKLHTGGVFGIKAGDVAEQDLLGYKAAGFWSSNVKLGGEPHQATVVLHDPATGRPLCILDGNAITTERTGAAGAIGLSKFARIDSASLCVFGAGVQARGQLQYALRVLPHLEEVRYLTFDGKANHAFEAEFSGRCALRLATDANDAVSNSDIVVTATPGGGALFDADAVRPGTHLTCVGADTKGKRELPAGLLERARVIVDDAQQARTIGECQWAPENGCVEIGDLIAGKLPFERHPGDITVFDMTGIALQDLTVARFLYRHCAAQEAGQWLSWPW